MGYTTDFEGRFELNKPLGKNMQKFLTLFNDTRRMKRRVDEAFGIDGEFFVFGEGFAGQTKDDSIVDYNKPPETQPGLWQQWVPTQDGTAIEWDGNEKFYCYTEWLVYLIHKILAPNGYVLNGSVTWQGEETGDVGTLSVKDNRVFEKPWKGKKTEITIEGVSVYSYPSNKTNFMRPDVVLLIDETIELSPNGIMKLLPETTDNTSMKDEIEKILIDKWAQIGMDVPSNFEDIVQDCFEDVLETADPVNWSDGDVSIAFRRWIEKQSEK